MEALDRVLGVVQEVTGVGPDQVMSRSRKRHIASARHMSVVLYHEMSPVKSLSETGRRFDRAHATVIHSLDVFCDLFITDKAFKEKVKKARGLLYG